MTVRLSGVLATGNTRRVMTMGVTGWSSSKFTTPWVMDTQSGVGGGVVAAGGEGGGESTEVGEGGGRGGGSAARGEGGGRGGGRATDGEGGGSALDGGLGAGKREAAGGSTDGAEGTFRYG